MGRPNVGKSSLLNLLAKDKVSIVDPTPGVTRDRVSVIVELEPPVKGESPKPCEVIDTGGFGVYVAEGRAVDEVGNDLTRLTGDIESQIAAAIESADVVLFCVDTQAGITPADLEIARKLREGKLGSVNSSARWSTNPPEVHVVATKCDGPKWEPHAFEMAALGFGEPMMLSALNNYLRRDFLDRLWEVVPAPTEDAEPEADLKIAIIGKRNAGKSSLVNAIAGQPRVIVSEIPGTTRDAIDVLVERDGQSVLLIDTAGLRRKSSFQDRVEVFAYDRVQRAIARADVVLIVVDAAVPVSQVDQQLAMLAQKAFKPVVLVVNKWDLAQGQRNQSGRLISPEMYEEYLRKEFKGLLFAPIAFVSATEKLNLAPTMELARSLHEQAGTRVSTGLLNRIMREILESRGPANKLGTFGKVYFVTQADVNPPTIVFVVNRPKLFTANYQRFLLNRLREQTPLKEVPIRLVFKNRTQAERLEEGDVAGAAEVRAGLEALPEDASVYFDDDTGDED